MADRPIEEVLRDQFLAEAEALAQLTAHPSWPRYEALLVQMRTGVLELLATARTGRRIAQCQGAAAILSELIDRPHQMVAAGRQVVDEEAQRKNAERTALDLADRVELTDDL